MGLIDSIERAASKPAAAAFDFAFLPITKTLPAIARWAARIEAIPSYERTYSPHWRT